MILLTRRGVPPPAPGALPRNVVELLSKPFTPEQLLSSVNAILSAGRQDGGLAGSRRRLGERAGFDGVLVDRPGMADAAPGAEPSPVQEPATGGIDTRSTRDTRSVSLDEADRQRVQRSPKGSASLRAALLQVASEHASGVLSVFRRDRLLMDVRFEAGKLVVVTTRDAERTASALRRCCQPKSARLPWRRRWRSSERPACRFS